MVITSGSNSRLLPITHIWRTDSVLIKASRLFSRLGFQDFRVRNLGLRGAGPAEHEVCMEILFVKERPGFYKSDGTDSKECSFL